MTSSTDTQPTPDEARALLASAGSYGRSATAGAGWPAVTFLLGNGAASSLGTIAMTLAASTAGYFVSMVAMLAWMGVMMGFLIAFNRSTKVGFGKRWTVYLTAWLVPYIIAMMVAGSSDGQNILGGSIAAAVLLVSSVSCAVWEARK